MAEFNEFFHERRCELDLQIPTLADQTGFTRAFLASYEQRAVNPTVRTLMILAAALKFDVVISARGVKFFDAESGDPLYAFDPTQSRLGMRNSAVLHRCLTKWTCPRCHTSKMIEHTFEEPYRTDEVRAVCWTCTARGKGRPKFYDADGKLLDPKDYADEEKLEAARRRL